VFLPQLRLDLGNLTNRQYGIGPPEHPVLLPGLLDQTRGQCRVEFLESGLCKQHGYCLVQRRPARTLENLFQAETDLPRQHKILTGEFEGVEFHS